MQNDDVSTACAIIQSFNLKCASELQFQHEPSSTVPMNSVITTIPPPGTKEPAGSAINLVVSNGPPVYVPDVVGDLQQVAESQLSSMELIPVSSYDTQDKSAKDCGFVIAQNPAPQTPVSKGSGVTITVGDGPKCHLSSPTTAALRSPTRLPGDFLLAAFRREPV